MSQDNFYHSQIISGQAVSFKDYFGLMLAGNLYLPEKQTEKAPALVIAHPYGAVKEQASNLYAQKLAEKGFVTLSFDLPFWGESEGLPRNAVSPDTYVESISAAIDFLSQQKGVRADNIGLMGICAGGGFSLAAAKIDSRIKALATASLVDLGTAARQGGKAEAEATSTQRIAELFGAAFAYTSGTADFWSDDLDDMAKEFYSFYRTPRGEYTPKGVSKLSTTHPLQSSASKFMNFYPLSDLTRLLTIPALFIAGENAFSRFFSEMANANSGEKQELLLIPNCNHVDLYDDTDKIPFDKLEEFFKKNLK
ncbi:MAG: alpha/beta hydrolase [Lactococcus sp.]